MRVPPVRATIANGASESDRGWSSLVVGARRAVPLARASLAGFYTDYLWFDSVGFGTPGAGLLWARFAPAAVFTVLFFVMMLVEPHDRRPLAPRTRTHGPRGRDARPLPADGRRRTRGRIRIAGRRCSSRCVAGGSVSGEWQRGSCSPTRRTFGIKDPQFHKDVGFYVFRLPFLSFVFDWLFAGADHHPRSITALAHYLNGGIRLQSPFQRVTPAGEGAPLGDPGADGAGEDRAVLPRRATS